MIEYKALHSASNCLFQGDIYVAFYAGEAECVKQKVFIFKKEKSKYKLFKALPEGSGNPVLFTMAGQLFCCYSMFTRPMENNVFDLWRTTYTTITNLTSAEDNSTLLATFNCPRSNPIYLEDGALILPSYDEEIQRGNVFYMKPGERVVKGTCMSSVPVIQPTAFKFQNQNFLLFRNFERNRTPEHSYSLFARFAFAANNSRIVFTDTKYTKVPNNNESVATINDTDGNVLVVYNAVVGRRDLTLAYLEYSEEENTFVPNPILKINTEDRASYPNVCFNSQGQLNICYTSYNRGINEGSSIAMATISKNYKKVLSTKFINGEDLNGGD